MTKRKTQVLQAATLNGESGESNTLAVYLIALSGDRVGEMFKLTREVTVIGRSEECDIYFDDEGISRRHCRIVRVGQSIELQDNNSTNGTYANNIQISRHVLQDGDKIQIGRNTILKFSFQDSIEEAFQRRMYEAAVRDPLTGIYNKRYLIDRLRGEFAYSVRHGVPMSLLLFDIDFFKSINDTYGHPAGDSVLRQLASTIDETIRTEDIFGRYGGEEFAIIARELEASPARAFADRIRKLIEITQFEAEGRVIPVTISIGVTTLRLGAFRDEIDMLREADRNLYLAKRLGRNRVESSDS